MTGSEKSLAKGSAAPGPVPQGVIRLYSMRFCPFALRARLVLIYRGIKHEIVNINLKSKPDWIFEKSPSGLVPSIETCDGKIIYDSPIICEYLDEAFPGPKLIPSDPYAKAEQKMLLEKFSAIVASFAKVFYAGKNKEDPAPFKVTFAEKFKELEEALAKKNTPYFGGESVSYIDYMIWPWFQMYSAVGLQHIVDNSLKVNAWQDRMMQDPAVKATLTKPENMVEFTKLYNQDSLEAADYGLE